MSYETRSFYMDATAGSESGFIIEVKNGGYSVLTPVPEKFISLFPFLKVLVVAK